MRVALFLAVTVLAQTNGLAQKPGRAATASEPAAQAVSCEAHRFETTVEVIANGKKRSSKVKLCGKVGQTDEEWANTLRDAGKTVQANAKMPKVVKDQIVTALQGEIDKIEIAKGASAKAVTSTLPHTVRPPTEKPPEYSVLPPIPTRPAAAPSSLAQRGPVLPKPRLSVQCMTPAELGGGSCDSLRSNSVLTIRADENLITGARLRFLRDGTFRAEVLFAPMRQGQSRRLRLPPKICAGLYRTTLTIEVLAGSANVAGTNSAPGILGPYEVRC